MSCNNQEWGCNPNAKPYLGKITNWYKDYFDGGDNMGLGYVIQGRFVDHPYFAGEDGYTSYVVKHNEITGEIETRNSRYTLVGPDTP